MAQQLLSSFGKKGVDLHLDTMQVDIEDTSYLSKYFSVAEFSPIFTAGKNPVAFNGSSLLLSGSEIKVECLDSNGNSLYVETPQSNIQFSDVANFLVSVFVYNEAYNGSGKFILVGTTAKNEVVRWTSNITIDKTAQNSSKVRFYNTPSLEVLPLLYPVVDTTIGASLTYQYVFTGNFSSLAVNPKKDTNQLHINPKMTDIDYRLILSASSFDVSPHLYPTTSFNTQMEGQPIEIRTKNIQSPFSYIGKNFSETASFNVKKVFDSKTLQVDNIFSTKYGQNEIVTNINLGTLTASYKWVAYNTASDSYQQFSPVSGSSFLLKQSYATIVYRNLRPFSGFIARHKLYRKSLVYPGDFQLIADEPLGSSEIFIDPITFNKTYNNIGTFYNQPQINKYWFISSGAVPLAMSHSVSPMINSVKIAAPNGKWADGSSYIIAKTSAPGLTNNFTYYPYDNNSFNNLSGSSYASNFISLKKGSLYVLSMKVIMEKPITSTNSQIAFYFTSSIPSITKEVNFIAPYGLNIGTIATADQVSTKNFQETQTLFFTPNDDYYGTLVMVPFNCNVTLSELSLKVYGDYGFSPDILFSKIPFPINVPNEGFIIKAELFDINSTLVFSGLQTIQSFDPSGVSLFVFIGNSNLDPTKFQFVSGSLTISQSLLLPNLSACPPVNTRLVAWNVPTHTPPLSNEGQVCYTNVDQLTIAPSGSGTSAAGDYLTLGTVVFSGSGLVQSTVSSISVKYDGTTNLGRKIIINNSGSKTMYP